MNEEEFARLLAEQLPPWAIGRTSGELVLGAQLPTRDGRRMGNAHVISIGVADWDSQLPMYTIMTDAGNVINMIPSEVAECFHPPQYVSDVVQVLQRFSKPE